MRLATRLATGAEIKLIYAGESASEGDWSEALRATELGDVCILRTHADAISELDNVLSNCSMGTRLYIAGPESFIGAAMQVAQKYDMNSDEVQAEHCGSAARRVYCVHCCTSQENVTTNVVLCPGCKAQLLVRDHYSRRLAAYMGVKADAETPEKLPPIRTLWE